MEKSEESSSPETKKSYRDVAQAFLSEKWTGPHECFICGFSKWTYRGLYELHALDLDVPISNKFIPVLVVECDTCGNMLTVNAHKGAGAPYTEGE